MSVGSWIPPDEATLEAADIDRLCAAAAALEEPGFGLDPAQIDRLAAFARDGGAGSPVDWAAAAETLDDARLVELIRLFTLAEVAFPAWKADARSPVIPLAAVLRRRGSYPTGLTAWIRARSDNRFLPYGSLLDRL